MKTTILITGGAGYIGSHIAKCLYQWGHDVIVYDNLSRGHREAVKWGPLIEGDILDARTLTEVLLDRKPQVVVHCAAFAYVGESMVKPGDYYRNNVQGTLTLLEAMRVAHINRLVFSSTCAIYGLPNTLPITEDAPRNPVNPYGRSKLMAETMIRDFGEIHGMQFVCLRYFNAAGCDPEGEIGESHDPETHLIPLAFVATTSAGNALKILGTDYPTADGTCIRDYVHVSDLAEGHMLAVRHLIKGGESFDLNLGYGKGTSVLEIIRGVEHVTGLKVAVHHALQRSGDPPILVGNADKARVLLGWEPRHAKLDDILKTAWHWHQNRDY